MSKPAAVPLLTHPTAAALAAAVPDAVAEQAGVTGPACARACRHSAETAFCQGISYTAAAVHARSTGQKQGLQCSELLTHSVTEATVAKLAHMGLAGLCPTPAHSFSSLSLKVSTVAWVTQVQLLRSYGSAAFAALLLACSFAVGSAAIATAASASCVAAVNHFLATCALLSQGSAQL